jgi:hypothetical protein
LKDLFKVEESINKIPSIKVCGIVEIQCSAEGRPIIKICKDLHTFGAAPMVYDMT